MRYYYLTVAQEAPGQRHGFRHQSAAIFAQIEDQEPFTFPFAQFLHRRFHITGDVLGFEAGDLEEGDSRLEPESIHEAGFDFAAGHRDRHGRARALAHDTDLHLAAARSAQQVSDCRRIFLA